MWRSPKACNMKEKPREIRGVKAGEDNILCTIVTVNSYLMKIPFSSERFPCSVRTLDANLVAYGHYR
jgi:hypothetical protein